MYLFLVTFPGISIVIMSLQKLNKRLYALRVLRKCGVACQDLVQVYCSLVRSVIEYAAPVWADLPVYLSKALELIQKRAFNIIFPGLPYNVALNRSGLLPLSQRREKSCQKLMQNFRDKGFLSNIMMCSTITIPTWG